MPRASRDNPFFIFFFSSPSIGHRVKDLRNKNCGKYPDAGHRSYLFFHRPLFIVDRDIEMCQTLTALSLPLFPSYQIEMSAVISPSTVPLSVKSSTYSHRTLSPIPASQTAIMSGAYPSGDLIPNGTKIHVDARDGTNVALALDLDARRSPADLVVDDETPPVVSELKDAAAIPIDPALRLESEEEQDESMAEVVIGQKRKAEDELEEEEEREEIDEQEADTANQQENSVPKEETQDEPVRELVLGVETFEGSEGGQPESETAAMEEADVVEKENKPQTAKRAPRKRRKWLKKGEGKYKSH